MGIRRINTIFFFTFAAMLFFSTEYSWAITSSEVAKLLAGDGAMNDQLGTSISVDGDTAVIGAPLDDDGGTDSGSAYIFVRNPGDGTWAQQTKLTADDAAISDAFGISVSVNNNTAVIGAFSDDDGGTNSGSAYVFVRNPSDGIELRKQNLLLVPCPISSYSITGNTCYSEFFNK